MKPRRVSAPLTDEDTDIWFDLFHLTAYGGRCEFESVPSIRRVLESDRRDADLMWNAQNHPIICATYTVEGERVELRAWRTSMRRAGVRL